MITCLFLLSLVSNFSCQVLAIYDPLSVSNNKYGIHILETTEIEKASQFVNSSGGRWGYVTIPIRANDRDLEKWTRFMEDCRKYTVIPILRIASFPVGGQWAAPNEYDLIDFANFLDELPWPTRNRYIVVYNEPNHQGEWGGFVNPIEYAKILGQALEVFHKKNPDFFVIAAGLDASAPNGVGSMQAYVYQKAMHQAWPGIFNQVDGLAFHAYGNPGFSTPPNIFNRVNVVSYRYELNNLASFSGPEVMQKPIFITESGWVWNSQAKSQSWLKRSFENIWVDKNIVAITPFILSAQDGPFTDFSFTDKNGEFLPFALEIMNIPKVEGKPQVSENAQAKEPAVEGVDKINWSWIGNSPQISSHGWLDWLAQKILDILILR